MTKNKKLKLLGALGTLGAVVAPIATTVSCSGMGGGASAEQKTANVDASAANVKNDGAIDSYKGELSFAMRSEDFSFWKPIMKNFTKKTGVTIKERLTSNQKADYATWDGTGSMPDIGLMDQNAAKEAMDQNEWFQSIDLNDLKDAKYDVSGGKEKASFDYLDKAKFSSAVLTPFKTSDHTAIGIPYAYSAQGLYLNEKQFDQSKTDLTAWLPKTDGTFAKVVVASSLDTMDKKVAAIKEFIENSGTTDKDDKSTLVKTDADIKAGLGSTDTEWFDNGPYAMYQRIGSIAKSFGNAKHAAWIKDLGFPFELVASLGGGIYKDNKIQDDVLKERFGTKGTSAEDFKKLYETYFGYFGSAKSTGDRSIGYATTPKTMSEPGEAETIWKGTTAVMLGYKWQSHMIHDNWKGGGDFDKDIRILSVPYGSANADALGIGKSLTGNKLAMAKEFLRFVTEETNTNNALTITGGKTISPNVEAAAKQKSTVDSNAKLTDAEKARQDAFFGSSTGSEYEGIAGAISSSSTEGVYDIYNGQFGGSTNGLQFNLDKILPAPVDMKWWKQTFDSKIKGIFQQIAILEA